MRLGFVLLFAFMIALLLSSCKVSQQQVVQKARMAPVTYSQSDSSFSTGNLLGNTIGDNFGAGGLGLSGTGSGGGGSGIGTLGISTMNVGYGSGDKKKTGSEATASKKEERKSAENTQRVSANSLPKTDNNALANLSQSKADDQSKVDQLMVFRDSPKRESNDDTGSKFRQETYMAGNHPKEMPAGSYAVVEVFDSEIAANLYASRLVRMGFDPNVPRFVTATNKWYVCLDGPNKPSKTRDKINDFTKLEIFKEAWQLIIN